MEKELLSITGTVEAVLFKNEDNGYSVIKIRTDINEQITATGYMAYVGVGEEIIADGNFITHPTYGEQFQIESHETRLPETVASISSYLGAGVISGIGPKLGEKIAKKFGEDTFDVLANHPDRLTEIKGITAQKAKKISEFFLTQNEVRAIVEFLGEYNLPLEIAPKIHKRLGSSAIKLLHQNPYVLTDEFFGIDFAVIDDSRENFGIHDDEPVRIDAAIIYILRHNLGNGHTFIPMNKLMPAAGNLLECEQLIIESGIERLAEKGSITNEHICGENAVYLKESHKTEDFLSHYLTLTYLSKYEYDFNVNDLIDEIERSAGLTYSKLQKDAIYYAATNGFMVLTGGPGTGKTTTVRGILEVFEALGLETVLAAPTGRAAKRLSELCMRDATTIHRLLEAGYLPMEGNLGFARNEHNPIDADVVILDEVSMVDIFLIQSLLKALKAGTRLILVGDYDQLPPVGPGNFLRDIITSEVFPVVELAEVFRQSSKSMIVTNAHKINHGIVPQSATKDGDFFIMKKKGQEIVETVVSLCKDRLPSFYGINPDQIQVISPAKHKGVGTAMLNRMLQEALNPKDDNKTEKRFGDLIFRTGDKVMQIRNNYELTFYKDEDDEIGQGIFNGDVGRILYIDDDEKVLVIQFDDKIYKYPYEMLTDLELSYAMTVHKSQGSEFDAVVLVIPETAPKKLLTRSILYTAITRAKSLLVLISTNEVIEYMVNNNTKHKRYSALRARIVTESGYDVKCKNQGQNFSV